jgi:hypothetical protein
MAKHVGAPAEIVDLIASHGGALTAELVCYDGDVQTLATLLKLNPQLDFMGAMGTLMNQPRCMELALQHQPNLLTAPIAYETAWWDFGGPENAEFARSIMKRGLNPNRGNWLGATLLHRCAGRGNIEVASVCLDFGANINAVDTDACSTPLGWAAREGKTKMVEFLLSKGADSNSPADRSWALPVAWAKRRGHRHIVACLLAAQ